MEKRKAGQSDLEVSVIAFGARAIGGWMWGGADAGAAGFWLSDDEIKEINLLIAELQINTKL